MHFTDTMGSILPVLLQRRPSSVGHYTGKAARFAAAEAAKDAQTAPAAATAGTSPSMDEAAAADPSHYHDKAPAFSSKYYRNPVPDSCCAHRMRPTYKMHL
jgi:hypothetical protein